MTEMQLVLTPKTGEVVDLKQASLAAIGAVLGAINDAEADLKSDKRAISDEVATRLDVHGRRSIDVDGWRLEINAPTEREFDMDELRATLAELTSEGTITEEKAKACVKWEPKPVWSEIKILTTDPRCAERVRHTFKEVPATRYARARHG